MRGEKNVSRIDWMHGWYILRTDVLQPLTPFIFVFALDWVGEMVKARAYQVFSMIAVLCSTVWLLLSYTITGNVAASYFGLAFVMTATVFILRFIQFTTLDYAVIFACFMSASASDSFSGRAFGLALPILYIFTALLVF